MNKDRQVNSTSYPINFLMVSSSDHVTPAIGLTVSAIVSKNGGAFASASGAITEIGNGWYSLAGNATDRNTLGELLIHATASGADDADILISIVTVDPFAFNQTGDTYAIVNNGTYGNSALQTILAKFGFDTNDNVKSVEQVQIGLLTDAEFTSAYTAPDNTDIQNIYNLIKSGGAGDVTAILNDIANETYGLSALQTILVTTGVVAILAASQPNYAPAKDGDKMDLINSPNATAISAFVTAIQAILASVSDIQNGLALDSTVMKAAGYTAPDNTTIDEIYNLIKSGGAGDVSQILTILEKFGFDVNNYVKVVEQDKSGFSLTDAQVTSISTAVHTLVVENGLTFEQITRIMFSVLAGLSNGGGTTQINFRDNANTKNRVTATVDTNGDRTIIETDGT